MFLEGSALAGHAAGPTSLPGSPSPGLLVIDTLLGGYRRPRIRELRGNPGVPTQFLTHWLELADEVCIFIGETKSVDKDHRIRVSPPIPVVVVERIATAPSTQPRHVIPRSVIME